MAGVHLREEVVVELQGHQGQAGEVEVRRWEQQPREVAAEEGEEAQHLEVVGEEPMGFLRLQARSRLGERQLLEEGEEEQQGFLGRVWRTWKKAFLRPWRSRAAEEPWCRTKCSQAAWHCHHLWARPRRQTSQTPIRQRTSRHLPRVGHGSCAPMVQPR